MAQTSGKRRGRAREVAVVAASGLAHIVALALLGLSTPDLHTAPRDNAPVVPLEIWTLPPIPGARPVRARVAPAPPRLHRTPLPSLTSRVTPLPLRPARETSLPAERPTPGAASTPLAGVSGDMRGVLRRSPVGCANRDAVGLTLREREGCDESFARGRENDAVIAAPMEPGKRAAWDAAAARKERIRKRKEAPPPQGVNPTDNAGGTRTNGLGILGY